MKVFTVVGARPQFIKAAIVSKGLKREGIEEFLVHTGQHFDANMSEIFFKELQIDPPHQNLHIRESSHAAQTGKMLIALEESMLEVKPDFVLVYGDTNSTLAAALAASKIHIPIVHVEAGLRSFNRKMPEEVNRIITDQLSELLFSTSEVATGHLLSEGIPKKNIFEIGDVMYDGVNHFKKIASSKEHPLGQDSKNPYILVTVHRAENTDCPIRLRAIFGALIEVAQSHNVILPLHPRTKMALVQNELFEKVSKSLTIIEPVGYLDMLNLSQMAKLIVTDSGGLQKEAYYLKAPCVTLRDETEWVETVECGANLLMSPGEGAESIVEQITSSIDRGFQDKSLGSLYGGGKAVPALLEALKNNY